MTSHDAPPSALRLLMIGPCPPPVHGVSLVMSRLAEMLRPRFAVMLRDVSPGTARGLAYHAVRWRRLLAAWGAILAARQGTTVYLAADGGAGLFYTALLAAAARLSRRRLIVHHHSFAYINRRAAAMALLARIAGRGALHIGLCPRMTARLAALYPALGRTMTLSNAVLFPVGPEISKPDTGPLRLAHLSNLSREKGLYDALAFQAALRARGVASELRLAGPIAASADADLVAAAVADPASGVSHAGPLYGDDKTRFLTESDLFLFPTRYVNEAEPLVLFEAMMQGLPVIAYDRGCIVEQLGEDGGMAVASDRSFVEAGGAVVAAWAADREGLRAASAAARRRMIGLHAEALNQFERLVAELSVDTDAAEPA